MYDVYYYDRNVSAHTTLRKKEKKENKVKKTGSDDDQIETAALREGSVKVGSKSRTGCVY